MWDMFKGVSRYALRYRLLVGMLFAGLTFESLYDVAVRYSLSFIIDKAVLEGDLGMLVFIIGLLAIGAVLFNAIVIGCDYIWARTGGQIINDIRQDMFDHLQHLPVGYYRRNSAGDLTARFNADVGQIETGMLLAFPMAVMGIVEIVATLVLMAFMHPLLFLIAAIGIIISLLVPKAVHNRALDASFVLRREEGRLVGYLQENLSGQSVVKAYGLEAHSAKDFSHRLEELLHKLARSNFLSYLASRLPSLVFLLLQLVVFGIGGYLAIQGQITVGNLVAYQALLIGLNSAIFNLTWTVPSFIDAAAGYQRVREILDEPMQIKDKSSAIALPRLSQNIVFDKVSFQYPAAEVPAVNNIVLDIKAGEYVVFAGRSGAGKSSIINLLMRFYEVNEGQIRLDDTDIRDGTLGSLRGQMGLVSQEVMLFDAPVRDNIRLGNLDASDEDIEAAAKAAEIHDLIASLPDGYDTLAGQGGSRFSGGERQRIALARALVRKPAVLILDEFSSALDPPTEAEILRTIRHIKGTCTIIAVTHRLAMAEDADRIVVMKGGKIVEMGVHPELVNKRGGEYARLWRRGPEEKPPAPKPGPAEETE